MKRACFVKMSGCVKMSAADAWMPLPLRQRFLLAAAAPRFVERGSFAALSLPRLWMCATCVSAGTHVSRASRASVATRASDVNGVNGASAASHATSVTCVTSLRAPAT